MHLSGAKVGDASLPRRLDTARQVGEPFVCF